MKKIISTILVVVLLVGFFAVDASAALPPIYLESETVKEIDYKETLKQYLTSNYRFHTDAEKLETMTLMYEKNGYQLWADEFTGEVATVNTKTGKTLFTNPIDIASSSAAKADTTRYELMSQLIVKFTDNGTEKYFNSFDQAAMNGQINVKNIKNGLRVEYTIGREETKYLVPRLIEKERLETNIFSVVLQAVMEEKGYTEEEAKSKLTYKKLTAYYTEKDPNNVKTDRELAEMQTQFEITKKEYNGKLMAVYICSAETAQELREVETIIKTYAPAYTYEQLDFDHELTEYSKEDRAPALFKMALEYRLDEFGLTARLPANGIRFNEAEYQLSDISVLPWMGAGSNSETGYTFFPDGSGAIFRFEDLNNGRTHTISGNIYGQDYAYHTVTGTHQEIIRYPVFGIVSNKEVTLEPETNVEDEESTEEVEPETRIESSGFVAILEEGDALAKLQLKHYGAVSNYNTVHIVVNPRPRDEYILSDAVSVGGNNSVTVVSKRKYVGDYKIRYIMLTDDTVAAEKGIEDYYEATWLGMATAYRAYLSSPFSTGTQNLPADQQTSVLNRLTAADIKEDIPIYIETFGSVETIKKVLSIPVNTKVALTSFDGVQEMYTQLSEAGVKNVNFKLTGYYNGGMYSSVPYKLKFEKSVGGKDGFKELLEDAKGRGYGVYVDFNFAYATSSAAKMFDGLSNKRDLVKAIDDRYTSRQYYSVTRQSYTSYFELAISPSRFAYFYDKVSAEYLSYNPIGISLSTLASHLNSDFDEDEPYNREDSKEFVIDLFNKIDKDYTNVMADNPNAYTWGYLDHMINVAVDSSRYVKASNSVPFLGVVLHGHVQFAGTPMNMEGNIGYAMLKAIENGSGLYFILSYENTELLKENEKLSQYYSVRYDIWFDELVERYLSVNEVLKDIQLNIIIDHEFLIGERVPDEDEAEADKIAAEKREEAEKLAKEEADRIALINQIRRGRYSAYDNMKTIKDSVSNTETNFVDKLLPELIAAIDKVIEAGDDVRYVELKEKVAVAEKAYNDALKAVGDEKPTPEQKEELEALKKTRNDARTELRNHETKSNLNTLKNANAKFENNLSALKDRANSSKTHVSDVTAAYNELTNGEYVDSIVEDITFKYNEIKAMSEYASTTYDKLLALYMPYYEQVLKILPDQNFLEEKEEDKEEEEVDEGYNYTKYTNDDGNIVAVTYGGKNGVDGDAYKTFLLNYNFFDITTVYNEVEYTIPAFGYVVIMH